MTPYMKACDALYDRLRKVFSPDGLALYEDIKLPKPAVTKGVPTSVTSFSVWVDLLPRNGEERGSASSHEAKQEFTLNVYIVVKHSDRNVATKYLQCYVNSVIMGVYADATLEKAVLHASPRIDEAGIDASHDKQYIAAVSIEVSIKTLVQCPEKFKELIHK